MPVYEYECKDCSREFELRRSFDDESDALCPECEGRTRRVFSLVPIVFKGPGFYVTDSRKNGSATAESKGGGSDS